ncbi:DUF6794 domain-containing protein [Ohtaekwangia kribbensis]|uniref:DUF6794 domain-containing protein n=1 Tax=Ohtaekwangia kribbensis TaxID=688913 RepID=A0ABW3K118_9BACT
MSKAILLTILACLHLHCVAQLAYPYKVYSENEKFFVNSTPFSDQVWTDLGKTVVVSADDTLKPIITINRYFSPDYLFLSNDGQSLFYLDNWIDPSVTDESGILTHYHRGAVNHIYTLSDFNLTDSTLTPALLYNSYSESDSAIQFPFINKSNNVQVSGDTLSLLLESGMVYTFSIATGEIMKKELLTSFLSSHTVQPAKRRTKNYTIDIPTQFGLPKLENGREYWTVLEEKMNVVFLEGNNRDFEQNYKHYMFEILIAIDSTGKCEELQIEMLDNFYREEISKLFRTLRFNKEEIPDGIEKWYFRYITGFRKKSASVARKERKQEIKQDKLEYKKRIQQDSIDHVYIPADLQDCFKQLDKLLSSADKQSFANASENSLDKYHMGLGLWIRNNWGLWKGSRLSNHFNKLGVFHPDDMSGIVIRFYHRYLNGHELKLDELPR